MFKIIPKSLMIAFFALLSGHLFCMEQQKGRDNAAKRAQVENHDADKRQRREELAQEAVVFKQENDNDTERPIELAVSNIQIMHQLMLFQAGFNTKLDTLEQSLQQKFAATDRQLAVLGSAVQELQTRATNLHTPRPSAPAPAALVAGPQPPLALPAAPMSAPSAAKAQALQAALTAMDSLRTITAQENGLLLKPTAQSLISAAVVRKPAAHSVVPVAAGISLPTTALQLPSVPRANGKK